MPAISMRVKLPRRNLAVCQVSLPTKGNEEKPKAGFVLSFQPDKVTFPTGLCPLSHPLRVKLPRLHAFHSKRSEESAVSQAGHPPQAQADSSTAKRRFGMTMIRSRPRRLTCRTPTNRTSSGGAPGSGLAGRSPWLRRSRSRGAGSVPGWLSAVLESSPAIGALSRTEPGRRVPGFDLRGGGLA